MNRIRRMTAWAAAVLLLLAPGIRAGAEVTAEKQTERGRVTEITWKDENGKYIDPVVFDFDWGTTTCKGSPMKPRADTMAE